MKMGMKISVKQVADVVGGGATGAADQEVSSVVIDSREAAPGSLFVALPGERVDGHDFLKDCAERGTVAALVQRDVSPVKGMALIRVNDSLDALQRLAAWRRESLKELQVIGITGSSGKTTTKELTAGVLAQKYPVFKSRGNHNNAIGLPLMIFEIDSRQRWAVLEMGMSASGEIERLCAISRPGLGVITNIGQAHWEHLGSQRAILEAKFELAKNLAAPRLLFLNGDDPLQRQRVKDGLPGVRVVYYGLNAANNLWATDVHVGSLGSSFTVVWNGKSIPVKLNLAGAHNVYNALAAFAVGLALDVEASAIATGLEQVRGEKRRLETVDIGAVTLIDDSYNANPDSMAKALAVLNTYPAHRRKIAFLGDMLELGPTAIDQHRLIGALAVESQPERLVFIGRHAEDFRAGALNAGYSGARISVWENSVQALASINLVEDGDVVLVKGSLGVEMDKIVAALKKRGAEPC